MRSRSIVASPRHPLHADDQGKEGGTLWSFRCTRHVRGVACFVIVYGTGRFVVLFVLRSLLLPYVLVFSTDDDPRLISEIRIQRSRHRTRYKGSIKLAP